MIGNKLHELSGFFLCGAVEVSQFFRCVSTLDGETTMLSRSVEDKSPNDAAPHPRKTDSSEARTGVHREEERSLQPLLPLRMACNGCGWKKRTRLTRARSKNERHGVYANCKGNLPLS